MKDWGKAAGGILPDALSDLSLMHRQDIQQGNIITQEMVNKLHPGMSRRQVRYVMGTPMLVDIFHKDRWDYLYLMQRGDGERTRERLSLYFENGRLSRIEGDFRPMPPADALETKKETLVRVPDHEQREKGLLSRTLERVGLTGESP